MKSERLILIALFSLCCTGLWAASPTGKLPVVYMRTTSGQAITDKENYVPGSVYIDPLQTGYDALGNSTAPISAQLKGRGNWTWNGFDKKPYKIKFDTKQKVLGMPSNKHWCLMAHADDNLGFLRNIAGYMLSERIGLRWTPHTVPVELVLNGQYKGLYFLTEHVRVGSKRVAIREQQDLATDSVSGGWLIEIDNYQEPNNVEFYEGNGERVWITPKSPEILSAEQRNYLEEQMNAINDALYAPTSKVLMRLIDIQEAAKYYLVQEIMEDCESYHGSCYLYKDFDQNGINDKWKFGPVWDFGNAYMRHQDQWIYVNPTWSQIWIGQLASWPEFQQAVQEQWYIFYHTWKDAVRADLRAYADLIESAAKKDASVWRGTQNYCDNSNYADVRDRFFRRYDWRINWLYGQWGEGIEPMQDIRELNATETEMTTKVLQDGHIYLLRGNQIYTLTGQRVR